MGLRGDVVSERRNSRRETAQFDLFDGAAGAGVGARQAESSAPGGGGEYLEICGHSNFEVSNDPRFDELRRLGLPRAWMMIAETVGFDAWLAVWRMLSAAEFNEWVRRDTGGTRMPMLRSYDSYLRFQRNRYIEALKARGLGVSEVARAVARNLHERLDESHVAKIMNRKVR